MQSLTYPERLEAESIHLFCAIMGRAREPVVLYADGKHSSVMVHPARQALHLALASFSLPPTESGLDFDDFIAYRDKIAPGYGLWLIITETDEADAKGIMSFDVDRKFKNQTQQTGPLKHPFTGARMSQVTAINDIIEEMLLTIRSERRGRAKGKEQSTSMEDKKQEISV